MAEDSRQTRKERRPRGPALSTASIKSEALGLIDAGGLDAFSYRLLAARLGCQPMSIYNHFPSRAHLIEALVEMMIAEASDFPETGPWQDRLRGALQAYRRAALNHPGLFVQFATFGMNTRGGLTFLDRILKIFAASGLSIEAQARHFRIVAHFISGACLEETQNPARHGAAAPVPFDEARRDFPHVMAVRRYFGTDRNKPNFDAGVTILITAMEAELSAPPRQGRSDS